MQRTHRSFLLLNCSMILIHFLKCYLHNVSHYLFKSWQSRRLISSMPANVQHARSSAIQERYNQPYRIVWHRYIIDHKQRSISRQTPFRTWSRFPTPRDAVANGLVRSNALTQTKRNCSIANIDISLRTQHKHLRHTFVKNRQFLKPKDRLQCEIGTRRCQKSTRRKSSCCKSALTHHEWRRRRLRHRHAPTATRRPPAAQHRRRRRAAPPACGIMCAAGG
jgi:hypothetical protein